MKMWNSYLFENGVTSDLELKARLREFFFERKDEILTAGLINASAMHLVALWEFGLIEPEEMSEILGSLTAKRE